MLKNDELITKAEALKRLDISRTTFDRRKLDCLKSPYRDAIVKNGNKIYVHWFSFQKFMDWQSKKEFKEKYGI